MSRMQMLTDEQWALLEPLLPSSVGRVGRNFRNNRRVVEGMIYRCRCGIAWRDLPVEFGPWQTVWKRHRRCPPSSGGCLARAGLDQGDLRGQGIVQGRRGARSLRLDARLAARRGDAAVT
ncbi:MAG: transposase [Actinophytocola sp.]|nr:transposase [Actinophytocola sp.]